MKIGAWKTWSVFERYAIVSQTDIRDAMTKLEAAQHGERADAAREQKAKQEQFGQGLGRIEATTPASYNNSLALSPQIH
jgi:hypothetical protein